MKKSIQLTYLVLFSIIITIAMTSWSSGHSNKKQKAHPMTDPAPLMLDGTIVPTFTFNSDGTITITYKSVTYITIPVDEWHKWYTYKNGGHLYFQDRKVDSPANSGHDYHNNDTLHNSLTLSPASGSVYLIGNGNLRPTGGGSIINIPIYNSAATETPSRYAIIAVDKVGFWATYP